ncbi:MAG: YggS family pyridoxal phosphate-dependent enzyme [Endomicrobium sp.]|jgi:pyridoxal phosphate enzyme (YggS family)|nr:YggS family pyridoxal phosphate-dependent enzyme [Endomicrobium sp.]
MKSICKNICLIRSSIDEIKKRSVADGSVEILAVTKTFPYQDVREALNCGINNIGESKIQEALPKFEALGALPDGVLKHFIGRLQSNKVKRAVENFDLIQSVDSLKLAKDIDRRAMDINKIQNCLIEVKVSGEESKAGISFNEAEKLYAQCFELSNVKICGLMTITPLNDDPQASRPYFKAVFNLFETLKEKYKKKEFSILSMGMSGDFKIAVEEGSNMVRIGSAIFGERNYGNQ